MKICGLWKQKIFNWPAVCAEKFQESTTLPNCCLQDVFSWAGRAGGSRGRSCSAAVS